MRDTWIWRFIELCGRSQRDRPFSFEQYTIFMPFRPKPPQIPPDLLQQFGEPEHCFGPNMRFRLWSLILGVVLLLLGLYFVVASMLPGDNIPLKGILDVKLSAGLLALGTAAIVLPWMLPLNWVIVCPRGLLRTRGKTWDSVAWTDVARFEGADLSGKVVTVRQCRIYTKAGIEWGFIADWIGDYERLVEVLRAKVAGG
jgi:hypothetical protein